MKLYGKEVKKADPYSLGASIALLIVLTLLDAKLSGLTLVKILKLSGLGLPIVSVLFMMSGHFVLSLAICIINFLTPDALAYLDEILQVIFVIVPIYKAFDTGQGVKQTIISIIDSGKTKTIEKDGFVIKKGINGDILKKYKGGGTEVVIPEGIKKIEAGLFSGVFENSQITSVTMPESLEVIGDFTFKGCKNLESVEIPDNVRRIGGSAFARCSQLYFVKMPPELTYLEDIAFADCPLLGSVEIPYGVKEIGKHTFRNCSALEVIALPETVASVKEEAFLSCDNLKYAICPTKAEIESGAFPKKTKIIRCNAKLTTDHAKLCYDIIKDSADMAMGINAGSTLLLGGIGGTAVKAASLPAAQVDMIVNLALVFDQYINESDGWDILNQINQQIPSDGIAAGAATFVAKKVISNVPIIGNVAGAVWGGAEASAKVQTVGWMAVSIFSKKYNNT